jgi:hypothetical protein
MCITKIRECIYALLSASSFGLYPRRRLDFATMVLSCPRLQVEEPSPVQPWWPGLTQDSTLRLEATSAGHQVTHLAVVFMLLQADNHLLPMPRPRGRPRRGSPWKPRRPSVSPPDSPSADSSPPTQSAHLLAPPPGPPNLQLGCLALIPRLASSFLHPTKAFTAPKPTPDPPKSSSGELPPRRRHEDADSYTSEQFKTSLEILYGLVFELRQGVADLQFRLQATDERVEVFLQTLASMQATFSSNAAEATPSMDPRAAPGGGHDEPHCSSAKERVQCAQGRRAAEKDSAGVRVHSETTKAEGTTDEMQVERQWADEVTYIEEEPWTADLQAAWLGYPPGV